MSRRHCGVLKRRAARLAAIGASVIICCLALLTRPFTSSAPPPTASAPGTVQARVLARHHETLATCEQRLERTDRGIPTMAIVGASYTAGVGPHSPALSWAVRLARMLHWNAVVYGVSGAGYVRAGTGGRGPAARLLARERLAALDPALVIVQLGHDDAGVPPRTERRRVRQAIDLIRAEAPHARIALLTVFTTRTPSHSAALRRTDEAIVAAGIAADHKVIIMDPLGGHWKFQHFDGGLHPTAAGDAWIARKVAAILRAHGVLPAAAAGKTPMICDAAGLGHHSYHRHHGGAKGITAARSTLRGA